MMSPKGMENFQNQVKQLVGSIQQSNDLDVHIALVQAPSYAKEYMEKYSSTDKTAYQICREYVDLFGMMQKNPNALDILIEEAKIQLRLWGSPEPTFLLCNSKLTFQLQMTPDRTNYITQGIDGVKRLRQGPDITQYRGLSVVHSRAYSMETGAVPRDVLRRRVRVAEYYRVPPQGDRNWELELYDESRDTWFKLKPDDLDRYADLCGSGSMDDGPTRDVRGDALVWSNYIAGAGLLNDLNPFKLKMFDEPPDAQWVVTMPQLLRPSVNLRWGTTLNQVETMHNNVFATGHNKEDYHLISQTLDQGRYFVPKPNCTNFIDVDFPIEGRNIPHWLFMNAAFLNNTCSFLWNQIHNVDRNLVRQKIIPFVFGVHSFQALLDYNAIPDGARMNIYHTVMFLGGPMRWHPDQDVRTNLEARFSADRIGVNTLRGALAYFVNRALDGIAEPVPETRIQLGRLLDEAFRGDRFPKAKADKCLFDKWSAGNQGILPIYNAAGVPDSTASLEDYRIEEKFRNDPDNYPWNQMPRIPERPDGTVRESTILDSFFYAAMQRMMTLPLEDRRAPEFWPELTQGKVLRGEEYEYVIIRPAIEHNMLGIILGRGGSEDLGACVWSQTQLSVSRMRNLFANFIIF